MDAEKDDIAVRDRTPAAGQSHARNALYRRRFDWLRADLRFELFAILGRRRWRLPGADRRGVSGMRPPRHNTPVTADAKPARIAARRLGRGEAGARFAVADWPLPMPGASRSTGSPSTEAAFKVSAIAGFSPSSSNEKGRPFASRFRCWLTCRLPSYRRPASAWRRGSRPWRRRAAT